MTFAAIGLASASASSRLSFATFVTYGSDEESCGRYSSMPGRSAVLPWRLCGSRIVLTRLLRGIRVSPRQPGLEFCPTYFQNSRPTLSALYITTK